MTQAELQDLLALHGYPSRARGEEVLIEVCWFCGNDRFNLELNPGKGVWSCWACRSGGRLDTLLADRLGERVDVPVDLDARPKVGGPRTDPMLDAVVRPAYEVGSAANWLARRGVTEEVAARFGLVVTAAAEHSLRARILIPALDFWTGTHLGWSARAYVSSIKPKYLTTLSRRSITGHRTRSPEPCLVVEGPFDGIAARRAGFQAAVLGGTDSIDAETLGARLNPAVPLIVLLDGSAWTEALRLHAVLRAIRPSTQILRLPPAVDPGSLRPEVLRAFVGNGQAARPYLQEHAGSFFDEGGT